MSAPHMPMMNEHGFLECPFCGESSVGIATDDDGWQYIECSECYCRTDGFRNQKLMTDTWNKRHGKIWTRADFAEKSWEMQNSDLTGGM